MIDHVAHPSFDADATHQYYTGVLGARLRAPWNARPDAYHQLRAWIESTAH